MAQLHNNACRNDPPDQAPNHTQTRNLRLAYRREDQLFKSLEFIESRQNAVFASVVLHAVLLTVLIVIPLFFYDALRIKPYSLTMLAPPIPHKQILEVTHWKRPALPRPKPKPLEVPPPKPMVEPIVRKPPELIPRPKTEEFKVPEVKVEPKPALVAKRDEWRIEPPRAVIKAEVFGSTGSSAKPTADLPPKMVQTGGFGDPNGVKGEGRPDKTMNVPSLGSFDLPIGEGAGNGTGGANGARAVVASSGFGNGVATDSPGAGGGGGRSGRGVVQKGSFGDGAPSAAAPQARKREAEAAQSAVEITFKPRPDYTPEARKLKLEGEVLLKVLFTASGQVKVLGVTRGLGHGLDETAVRAAEQIRFKPATREGTPVDSTATVHIVFQLAY